MQIVYMYPATVPMRNCSRPVILESRDLSDTYKSGVYVAPIRGVRMPGVRIARA